jgi:outer membrane protein insertion porin family
MCLFLGCWPSTLRAQVIPLIHKIVIRHVGPPAVSDELVRASIRIKEGDPYNKLNVDRDIQNLYATGYFYNIRVGEEMTNEGIVLTYVVQGRPIITDIKFVGNKKVSTAKLMKKIRTEPSKTAPNVLPGRFTQPDTGTTKSSSLIGQPLDERKLFEDAQEIQKMYQKKGYQKTKAAYSIIPNENAGTASVVFEITESPKVRIDRVDFVGGHAYSQSKLRKIIKTRGHWMFSWLTGSGKLKDDEFDEDKDRLADFYRNEGYIDFELKDVQFDQIAPNKMIVRFVISEGKRYRVGQVGVKGNKLFSTEELLKGQRTKDGKKTTRGLQMTVGEIFTPKGLARDREKIEDMYGSRGYIEARITPIRNANTETGTIDLVYEIEEGEKAYIEKIEIKGNTKTKDRVIRRELAVSPGEVFDMVRVKVSTNRLTGLNYFEKVEARPDDTEIPNRKNLIIAVDERNTGNFTMGAGFSTVDNLVGFVELNQGNFDLFNPPYFTGAGQKFRLRAQIGTERQDYLMSFIEPWFLGRKLALGVDLYHRDLNYLSTEYDQIITGTTIGLTRTLGSDFLIGGLSYTIQNVGIHNVSPSASEEIKAEEGDRIVSKIGATLAYDTRFFQGLLPVKGQRTELTTELAGGPFGGETDFFKWKVSHARYFKGFYEGHILELIGVLGVVESYGDSPDVPLFDRWFLGGAYSLRGYDYRDVGPKDSTGEPIGGNTYWFGSAEYSVPIIERLRFAVFYDIGNVYRDSYDFDFGNYSDNWGVGIRLNLPIGPLRLDYGIPITHDKSTSGSGKFQFTVGYTRDF